MHPDSVSGTTSFSYYLGIYFGKQGNNTLGVRESQCFHSKKKRDKKEVKEEVKKSYKVCRFSNL